jgi:heme O synthase-like polyprenyltransferase
VAAALVVVLASLLPAWSDSLPTAYVVATTMLGLAQLCFAIGFLRQLNQTAARHLLTASIAYLPAMLGLMALLPLI